MQHKQTVRRSGLTMPVVTPRFVDNAWKRGCDFIVLDLEDSVAVDAKPKARDIVRDYLNANIGKKERPRLFVRVNALDTGMTDAERVALAAAERNDVTYLSHAALNMVASFSATTQTITRVSGAGLSAIKAGDLIQVWGNSANATVGQTASRTYSS